MLAKRAFDVAVSAIALLVAAVPMAALAVAIRLTMGSPILFRQVRPGLAGRTFTIQLREPETVSRAVITVANVDQNDEGLTRARLRFSDGSEEVMNLGSGALNKALGTRTVIAGFTPHTTTSIEVTLTDVEGSNPFVGLADVTFDGVDLREHIQAPDDIFVAADAAAGVNQTPLAHRLQDFGQVGARDLGLGCDVLGGGGSRRVGRQLHHGSQGVFDGL